MRIRTIVALLLTLGLFGCSGTGSATGPLSVDGGATGEATPKSYFVTEQTEVRIAPNSRGTVTNHLDRGQQIDVFEVRSGWARISPWYDGRIEGAAGQVARWVRTSAIASTEPAATRKSTTVFSSDPRIDGLPKVGQGGLSKRDVQILYAASLYYLETGKATRIEYGDKSVDRPGVYYLNFGGPQNHFFRPADIPELEARITKLGT